MIDEPSETHAMWRMGVVETGVASLDRVQRAVEGRRLRPNLRDEVAGQMHGEASGVRRSRDGIEVSVDEVRDGLTMHGRWPVMEG